MRLSLVLPLVLGLPAVPAAAQQTDAALPTIQAKTAGMERHADFFTYY